jgi:hypothetical protein
MDANGHESKRSNLCLSVSIGGSEKTSPKNEEN